MHGKYDGSKAFISSKIDQVNVIVSYGNHSVTNLTLRHVICVMFPYLKLTAIYVLNGNVNCLQDLIRLDKETSFGIS